MPPTPPRSPAARPAPTRAAPTRGPPYGGRRPRWAMRAATALSVAVLAAAGIGHAVVTSLDAGIARVDPFKDMKNRPAPATA